MFLFWLELLQPIIEALTIFIVNRTERGNSLILYPALLFVCWYYQVQLHYRKRKWFALTPREQVLLQQKANKEGRRNEPYPL
jgi:hypothetical protein